MSRKPGDDCTFRQRDVKAAIKAAKEAGLENFRVEIDRNGTISVVPMAPGESVLGKGPNEWDDDL
ncbi:hypothetical protein QWJ07_10820 [Frankia sp. RB7]|nr:hypothetical protein [Frankia sp. RB7]